MKKTQKKILINAVKLFNKMGVSNVRLQDIAAQSGISAGNLSYHYNTKKDLMQAVLDFMKENFRAMSSLNIAFLEKNDYLSVTKNYLGFQIRHRFFNRDILEIINLVPDAKNIYEDQMKQVLNFTKNGMFLAVGKGIIHPQPHEGHYDFFAKNIWAILNSWLIEWEVLGEKKVSMQQVMLAIWESHYPYFTEKGKDLFVEVRNHLPQMIEEEMAVEH